MARPPQLLDRFFAEAGPIAAGDRLVVAFSGGTDSLALLAELTRQAPKRGLELVAAHLDHGLDPGSAGRARAAAHLASRLGARFATERRAVGAERRQGESPEAAARRVRYAFLERVRRRYRARWIATAHHAGDQAETVLLRLAAGSALPGIGGIAPRQGHLVRPLLGASRADLEGIVATAGLEPIDDPSNRDLSIPRNRVRHHLLPLLDAADPGVGGRLSRLAAAGADARASIEVRLEPQLAPRPVAGGTPGIELDRDALARLPEPLWPFALGLLHRRAGRPYPPAARVAAELRRQLAAGGRVGCDAGGGWRYQGNARRLRLIPVTEAIDAFAYTLQVPGEVHLTELGARFRVERRPVAPWMFRGARSRAALALPIDSGATVTVRNRRAGDRLRPFGCRYRRRLKEVLIDRQVPRSERSRIPLLVVDRKIAWVPGVTIDDRYRIADQPHVWVAQIESA